MNFLRQIDKFHKTRLGYLLFGIVELALGFVCGYIAIGNGSIWLWLLAFILLAGFIQNVAKLIGEVLNGSGKAN